MSDLSKRSKGKKKLAAADAQEDPTKLTPDEEAVAKALLWELPSKEGKLAGMKVRIFLADEALDFLLKSRFASPGKGGKEPVIKDARSASQLLSTLLFKGLFQRALKMQKEKRSSSRRDEKAVSKRDEGAKVSTEKSVPSDGQSATAPARDDAVAVEDAAARERREKRARERQEKRKRGRPRLEIHDTQVFSPNPGEVYIWHYDPTRPRNVVLGFLMVLGSILLCLFPMWPLQLRTGTYYLSVSALCLLGSLVGLALIRFPLFGLVWCLSFGRLQFWLLPNLTEDVGVLESFVPVISYDWSARTSVPANSSSAITGKKAD